MVATANPQDAPASNDPSADADAEEVQLRFSPEEEETLVAESNTHKAEANSLFTSGNYDAAISKYDEALAVCPNYLDYDLAVLRSNVAACHLKLEEWKEAVENATKALDGLDKLEREEKEKENNDTGTKNVEGVKEEDDDVVEVEIVSAGAAKAGPAVPAADSPADVARRKRQEDIARIRSKALMRRARAKSELGGWRDLEDAQKDYQRLTTMDNLSLADKKIVKAQLRALPPRMEEAKQKEIGEMWGKLKDLGNGLLKPFGLSTDQFNMVKDEKTGGYSLNFGGSGGGGSK
ncbi:Tetratricopeptide repeat protein 1 [Rhypophila decipiens]|uniref:Tetratricopeptide repeat protein 1 n=1 Tax=Rhypophila decipiens TaxID=261697 RepID=A0AAN7BC06_9PEZI|nr:Tetratricopeptide repeat protein 1 [Rhypophila decipiens]